MPHAFESEGSDEEEEKEPGESMNHIQKCSGKSDHHDEPLDDLPRA